VCGGGWANTHLILAIAWLLTIPASFVFGWWESIAFVVFASIYANFIGHWSAWQAARAERETQARS
jgi:hypothetical protein